VENIPNSGSKGQKVQQQFSKQSEYVNQLPNWFRLAFWGCFTAHIYL